MSDAEEQSKLSRVEDANEQPKEPSEDSKKLLAAFQEDMKAEMEMLNRVFGDKHFPLKKTQTNPSLDSD